MKNLTKSLALFLSAALIAAAGLTGCKEDTSQAALNAARSDSLQQAQPVFDYKLDDPVQAVGQPQRLSSYRSNLVYDLQYPETGNSDVDQQLSGAVQQIAQEFASATQASSREDGKKPGLYGNYQSFTYGDGGISVALQLLQTDPDSDSQTETVETLVFNGPSRLSAQEIFRQDKLPLVADAIKAAFQKSDRYRDAATGSQFDSGLASSYDALGHFALDGETVRFFFDKGRLFPDSFGVVSVSVPKEELADAFSFNSPKPFRPKQTGAQQAVAEGRPVIALTFDDGPRAASTNRILDKLEQTGSKATFFVLGSRAQNETDALKREAALGCEIANHSMDHKSLDKLPPDGIRQQIDGANQIIQNAVGAPASLVRPPYGAVNQTVIDTLHAPLVLWDLDTQDWKTKNAQATINAVLNNVGDGDIVLMHDIHDATAEACETLIPELVNRGFYLATVSEMFEAKGIPMQNGQKYFKAVPKQ